MPQNKYLNEEAVSSETPSKAQKQIKVVVSKKGDLKRHCLQNTCLFLLPSSTRPGEKEQKSGGVKFNIHNSAELTTLPAGIGDTAGETPNKLQCEHISTDTQRLYICVILRAYLALI